MTVERLIELLQKLPNPKAEVYVWDPEGEVSGIPRDYVKDIYEPTDNTEVYLVTDFG